MKGGPDNADLTGPPAGTKRPRPPRSQVAPRVTYDKALFDRAANGSMVATSGELGLGPGERPEQFAMGGRTYSLGDTLTMPGTGEVRGWTYTTDQAPSALIINKE